MGNNNSKKQKQKLIENKNNKNGFNIHLTSKYISDITFFCDYEKKYKGISNANIESGKPFNNYIFLIVGLIDGFIEIYKDIFESEFKLALSFQAHRDIISKILQLKRNGYLLTGSFDNSLKVFKLSKNCTKESLIYTFYLDIIFNRIYDMIKIQNEDYLLISVFNHIIYFPYSKNNLSEEKNYLSDYHHSKVQHNKNYLNNLLEINKQLFLALDDNEYKILFFQLITIDNIYKDIIFKKSILINYKEKKSDNDLNTKICIENLFPKYKLILVSIHNYIEIIDINYLEIISIHELIEKPFYFFYNFEIECLFILERNNIFKYKISLEKCDIDFLYAGKENMELRIKNGLENTKKSIYNQNNNNVVFLFDKRYLIKIEMNFT